LSTFSTQLATCPVQVNTFCANVLTPYQQALVWCACYPYFPVMAAMADGESTSAMYLLLQQLLVAQQFAELRHFATQAHDALHNCSRFHCYLQNSHQHACHSLHICAAAHLLTCLPSSCCGRCAVSHLCACSAGVGASQQPAAAACPHPGTH
jgi:hypothetical protein